MGDDPARELGLESRARSSLSAPEIRPDGWAKVTGAARYAADLVPPGALWAAFLGSPHPHARLVTVDVSSARQRPGVAAILTGEDIGDAYLGRRLLDWPVLARDRVRFIGDRVAAVAAETRELAQAALDAIAVQYDALEPVLSIDAALRPDAPVLHPSADSYGFLGGQRRHRPHPNVQGFEVVEKGPDLSEVFRQAPHVFEHTFHTPRQHQGYIEPHACSVWLDDDGRVHVVSTNKAPFPLRQQMSATCGIPEDRIIVHSEYVGGDFGGKGFSLDEFACYFLARATGRPVRSVASYTDELQAMNPRHAAVLHLRTAVGADGRFLAHETEVVFDGGAYAAAKPSASLVPGFGLGPGGGTATLMAYHVPSTRLALSSVYTNTVPGGHMRAPGETQALFAGESHVDLIAAALMIDPLELRRINALRDGDVGVAGERFKQPRAHQLLDAVQREVGWSTQPLPPNVGRGLALGARHVGGGRTSVLLSLERDGTIDVLSGMPDQGAGSFAVIQRVVATTLGIETDRVRVRYGTTETTRQDLGAGASRVTNMLGNAALHGATIMAERLRELAGEVMGWSVGQVVIQPGQFAAGPERAPFAEVARRILDAGPIEVLGVHNSAAVHDELSDFNFSAYCAEVHVDPETGQVTVRDVVLVADVGTIINPVAHQGQLEGGFVYGFGCALMEDLLIEDGRVMTSSLGEYKLPTSMDIPPLRVVHAPTTVGPGPFGAKMAGELSNTGVAPAIANAIAAATGSRVLALPCSSERVLKGSASGAAGTTA